MKEVYGDFIFFQRYPFCRVQESVFDVCRLCNHRFGILATSLYFYCHLFDNLKSKSAVIFFIKFCSSVSSKDKKVLVWSPSLKKILVRELSAKTTKIV